MSKKAKSHGTKGEKWRVISRTQQQNAWHLFRKCGLARSAAITCGGHQGVVFGRELWTPLFLV